MSEFGNYLKKKRAKANLTQGQVALALGYTTPQFISNWERGLASPPLDKINQLINIYKIDPEEIIQMLMDEQEQLYRQVLGNKRQKGAG